MTNATKQRVLLVLLDEQQRLSIKPVLRDAGFEVSTAADRHMAVKLMSEENSQE